MQARDPQVAGGCQIARGPLGEFRIGLHPSGGIAQQRFDQGCFEAEADIEHTEAPRQTVEAIGWPHPPGRPEKYRTRPSWWTRKAPSPPAPRRSAAASQPAMRADSMPFPKDRARWARPMSCKAVAVLDTEDPRECVGPAFGVQNLERRLSVQRVVRCEE